MFGRDGHKQQPVVRRSSRRPFMLFFALTIVLIAVVIMVISTRSDMLDGWLTSGERMIEDVLEKASPDQPDLEAKPRSRQEPKNFPAFDTTLKFEAMDVSVPEQVYFDPIARSRWRAKLKAAAAKDRVANLQRAQNLMNDELMQVNANIEVLSAVKPADRQERDKKKAALATYRAQAQEIVKEYENRAETIEQAVDAEYQRRDRILRGLED